MPESAPEPGRPLVLRNGTVLPMDGSPTVLQDTDVLIVDVREPQEFAQGHIPGALNVPRGTLEGAADQGYKHRVQTLCDAQTRDVVLYCATGGRSAMAAKTLQEMGFTRATSLAGGIEMWAAEGLPVVKD